MLTIDQISYQIEDNLIFDNATAKVGDRQKIGLIGRNGAGKSTLLKLISGSLSTSLGSICLKKSATLGIVEQETPSGNLSIIDYVLNSDSERTQLFSAAESSVDPQNLAEIHEKLNHINAYSAPARAAQILFGLGFSESDQQRSLNEYSGGWKMRVALGVSLFRQPDLLLLDEPTNYLDLEGTIWLHSYLSNYQHALLIVSHDRKLLNTSVNNILHLRAGKLKMYSGGYDDFEKLRKEEELQNRRTQKRNEEKKQHYKQFIDRFRYQANKAKQAQSRLKALSRLESVYILTDEPSVQFAFPKPKKLDPPLLMAENVAVRYTKGLDVLRNLNFQIDVKDRIALLGRNGNGKTTLARLIAGDLLAAKGKITPHRHLNVGFFSQNQLEDLSPNKTAVEHLAPIVPRKSENEIRSHLAAFGLIQEKSKTSIGSLSGGERSRLLLAILTALNPNLLILDEPTNHLDIDAREALIHALNEYSGAIILISHDRDFIQLTANTLWLVDSQTITPYSGDLDDYNRFILEQNKKRKDHSKSGSRTLPKKPKRKTSRVNKIELRLLVKTLRVEEKNLTLIETKISEIERQLNDENFYKTNPKKANSLYNEHRKLNEALSTAEERWMQAAHAVERANYDLPS